MRQQRGWATAGDDGRIAVGSRSLLGTAVMLLAVVGTTAPPRAAGERVEALDDPGVQISITRPDPYTTGDPAASMWSRLGRPADLGLCTLRGGGTIDLANGPGPVYYGDNLQDQLGRPPRSIATGDLDGDGFDDLVLGIQRAAGPGNSRFQAGEVWVIYGTPTGPPEVDLVEPLSPGVAVIYGADREDLLGSYVAAGDLDGDGYDDLVIAALGGDGPAGDLRFQAGEVWVFYGGPVRLTRVDLRSPPPGVAVIYGADSQDGLGESAVSVGDLDGDGFDDLFLGALGAGPDNSRIFTGEIWILAGGPARITSVDLASPPPGVSVIYGAGGLAILRGPVAIGDLNGDSVNDLVLSGIRVVELAEPYRGEFWVIYGTSSGLPDMDLAAPQAPGVAVSSATTSFPYPTMAVGDLDGDGFDDLVVGEEALAKVWVIYGGPAELLDIDLAAPQLPGVTLIHGDDEFNSLGISVIAVDLGRDGFDEIIIGASLPGISGAKPGEVYVIHGRPSRPTSIDVSSPPAGVSVLTIHGVDANDRLGDSIATGDLDGDGFMDLAIGARFGDGRDNTFARSNAGEVTVIPGCNGSLARRNGVVRRQDRQFVPRRPGP